MYIRLAGHAFVFDFARMSHAFFIDVSNGPPHSLMSSRALKLLKIYFDTFDIVVCFISSVVLGVGGTRAARRIQIMTPGGLSRRVIGRLDAQERGAGLPTSGKPSPSAWPSPRSSQLSYSGRYRGW